MSLAERYEKINFRIAEACKKTGRARNEVQLIAVSKSQSLETMLQFQSLSKEPVIFGENYVQELKEKASSLDSKSTIHFIGGLQTNKVKEALCLAHVIESVDSEKLVNEIIKEAKKNGKTQEIFLQVNISADPRKRGFQEGALLEIYTRLTHFPELKISGLMTITEFYDNPELARPDFAKLRELRDKIDPHLFLSMGMSSDYEIAIEEGATHIRVGSALFGERSK